MPLLIRRRTIGTNQDKLTQVNGLYIHSSPPRVVAVNINQIKHWIKIGDFDKLDQVVLEGKGSKLLGEYSPDNKIRTYLKSIPIFMSKIDLAHDAVSGNSLSELQAILQEDGGKRKLASCKDQAGVGLLHKAVYYDIPEITHYLVDKYPYLVNLKDREGRTPCHYCAACKDPMGMMKILTNAGADSTVTDAKGKTPQFYIEHSGEIELPQSAKIMPHQGQQKKPKDGNEALVLKPSNIRIWIHQRDLGKLQRVLWEGHGAKLRVETSNNPRVKRFLEACPHIMGLVKEIHTAAINDNLDLMKEKTEDPVPAVILSSKDANGLTVLHKAAGLGRLEMAEYILEKYPQTVSSVDNEGRTPLHYAATLKDQNSMYNLFVENGADESKLDNRQKTAGFYRNRPMDIDSKLLVVVPEAPRIASSTFPSNWDWGMLSADWAANLASRASKRGSSNNNNEPEEAKVDNGNTAELANDNPETTADEITENDTQEDISQAVLDENGAENDIDANDDETINNIDEPFDHDAASITEDKSPSPDVLDVEQEKALMAQREYELQAEAEDGHDEQEHGLARAYLDQSELNGTETNDVEYDEDIHNQEDGLARVYLENAKNELPTDEDQPPVEDDDRNSGNSERVIEGIVNGDDEQLNNDGQDPNFNGGLTDDEIDAEVREMVESANMEQLAALVLNGNGDRLIGQRSDNPELQAFLDNVPSYMNKINRVHLAARDGNLRDLQAALDRRKFAIAKDKVSPNGASPLHVATIFGNTSIVRYLAGRFPETVQVEDNNGRTPLHYAATIADNGHYYNLLLHLGANAKAQDNLGHMAEYYRNSSAEMSHRTLLIDFDAEDEIESRNALTDRDSASANNQVDIPLFRTEEGRYLATSLGDPLIKGLTEVANKRPKDPIAYLATYLYNFANNQNETRPPSGAVNHSHEVITMSGAGLGMENNEPPPPTIDVVTLDPDDPSQSPDAPQSAFSAPNRDEHGQSMLHFAAARSHGRNALFQLLEETEINIGYRDELYRTARDVSIQANIAENTAEIDRWVMHVAARGDTDKLVELLLEGYDHILDITDEDDKNIVQLVEEREQPAAVAFLQSILAFEEKRERVHHAIRLGDLDLVRELLADTNDTGSGKLLAIGKNNYGRCTLHIAVLCQREEIADFISNTFPDTLRVGDNLERTALHYAMGVEKVESISKVLVKAGAKRVLKDLKGRQATYYFMNKSDILRLQEEEETF